MKLRSWSVQREELVWSWPLRSGSSAPAMRVRAILSALDDEGAVHQAEIAPCPGVHAETLEEALRCWQDRGSVLLQDSPLPFHRWNWTAPYFGMIDSPELPLRSVQTACEQLLLSLAQKHNPIEYCLPDSVKLEGSALLPCLDDAWDDFLELWDQGFRVFKCKVGRTPAGDEYAFLQKMIQSSAGQIRLRLDANRLMTPADLAFWQERSKDLPLEYWEEAAGLEPRAFDETLWDAVPLPTEGVSWILKPSRLGLSRTVKLLKQAAVRKIPCILSNAFDSALSLRCGAWIYAAFCADPRTLGYGTTRFLPPDRWQSPRWGNAWVTIPRHPFAWGEET